MASTGTRELEGPDDGDDSVKGGMVLAAGDAKRASPGSLCDDIVGSEKDGMD